MNDIDLYPIVLDGLVDVLIMHDVSEITIPNDFTQSIANKCISKIKNTYLRKQED